MVDLGAWLLGHYRVAAEPDPDEDVTRLLGTPDVPEALDPRLPADDDDPAP